MAQSRAGDTAVVPRDLIPPAHRAPGQPVTGVALRGCGRILRFSSGQARYAVGGAPACDLVLDDPFVSRYHCFFQSVPDGRWHVRDAGSTNGTFVNGQRVEAVEIVPGNHISLGASSLVVLGPEPGGFVSARSQLKGDDPQFLRAISVAERAGRGDCNVLLLGETGTGKELFARLIHESSRRVGRPFVAVNCGGIPRELTASELFGHEKGAFTGAVKQRDGAFIRADGGRLFLDEVGELPRSQQPHLLRALESGRVQRVGSDRDRWIDVVVVAATNRDPGVLRDDLYHRLATVVISLPALRDRRGDIPTLVRATLQELEGVYGPKRVSNPAMRELWAHDWPGNIRELRQAVRRAAAMGEGVLEINDFFPGAGGQQAPAEPPGVEELMRNLIRDALDRYGSYRLAVRALGMPKSTLADRAQRYGLSAAGRSSG
jgi:DNA-binding NtrC family response regulator